MSFLEDSISSDWASTPADSVPVFSEASAAGASDVNVADGPGGDVELRGSLFRAAAEEAASTKTTTTSDSVVADSQEAPAAEIAQQEERPAESSASADSHEVPASDSSAAPIQEDASRDVANTEAALSENTGAASDIPEAPLVAEQSEEQPQSESESEEESDEEEPLSEADREKLIIDGWWKTEEALSVDERRRRYRCGDNFVELASIPSWPEYSEAENIPPADEPVDGSPQPAVDDELAAKISHWTGDITRLEIDGIVNAANEACLGGGGIDGAIHRAAGRSLFNECSLLHGCQTGFTKITRGYNLPARFVLHTVGPIGRKDDKLESCYRTCLDLVAEHGIRTVAFCGISTGIFGFPLYPASRIALETTRSWLEEGDNRSKVDRIIFCTFLAKEKACYDELIPKYFPTRRDERLRAETREAEEAKRAEEEEARRAKEEAEAQRQEELRLAAAEEARLQAEAEVAAAAKARSDAIALARAQEEVNERVRAEEEAEAAKARALQEGLAPPFWVWAAGAAAVGIAAAFVIRRRS